jgi:hypothetical protein
MDKKSISETDPAASIIAAGSESPKVNLASIRLRIFVSFFLTKMERSLMMYCVVRMEVDKLF